jgi:redox-sensitive bicupin YhaK (pirin superfamily)
VSALAGVRRRILTRPARDGAGVNIRRIAGETDLDPFLMLDEFGSDDPDDYLAGFPEHPHRGFETVTYMLAGHMEHRDSVGNHGRIGPGDVQWMTAGRGIVHSEMPAQEAGLMHGFQLWVNLPARDKMIAPRYQEIADGDIPRAPAQDGTVKVIAGEHAGVCGAVTGIATAPTYLDARLERDGVLVRPLDEGHTTLVYVYDGAAAIGRAHELRAGEMAILDGAGALHAMAVDGAVGLLVLAARPLREPVTQYGPFVMTTSEEIEQAIRDYQSGRLGR